MLTCLWVKRVLFAKRIIQCSHLSVQAKWKKEDWCVRIFLLICLSNIMCGRAQLLICDSLQPRGLQPTRLLCSWDFPGKNTGVGCHFLLQGIFLTQELHPGLLHCRQMLRRLSHQGSPHGGISIISISVHTKLNSSSPPHILVSISTPLSINYNTLLPLYRVLNWFYPSPLSHISRLSQENLSYFNCVMSLCSPFILLFQVTEQLPGWPVSPSLTSSTGKAQITLP